MCARAWAHVHTFMHKDNDGLYITQGCSSRPQYFMNIPPLSVLHLLFFSFILACSALFLPKKKKKKSFLSVISQKIAGVRQNRQKSERREKVKWSERERERFDGICKKGWVDGRGAAKVRQQQRQISATWELNLTFHPKLSLLFHTSSHTVAVSFRLCKVSSVWGRHCTSCGRGVGGKEKGGCQEW